MKMFFKFLIGFGVFSLIFFYLIVSSHNLRENVIFHSQALNLLLQVEDGNLKTAKVQPQNGQNVFFVESSDSVENITLSARQACAVESAALANPHLKIFVIFVSRERFMKLSETPQMDAISSYPNVFINYIEAEKLSIGTPFEEFFKSNKLSESIFRREHTSDVIRLLMLWSYGGTYLDTDMIVRQKLDSVPPNYACPESLKYMNGAILNFESHDNSPLVDIFTANMIDNFNGGSWGTNGPIMVTRVLQKLCNATTIEEMLEKESCEGFHLLPIEMCYAVPGMEFYKLMENEFVNSAMAALDNSLVVHLWNSVSKTWKLQKNHNSAYVQLGYQFCPKVMAIDGNYF